MKSWILSRKRLGAARGALHNQDAALEASVDHDVVVGELGLSDEKGNTANGDVGAHGGDEVVGLVRGVELAIDFLVVPVGLLDANSVARAALGN